ncbi:MAG TPA: XdhC family protein [Polyangia bacterium]|jgi:xanthine/CO dehydrogenase XdhC/CoxF family maturation factor|nr:XdhC family protein [Polyangia bacterium]
MSDLKAIVNAARGLRATGQPFLLATVVAVRGSSYRRPGARMIIADDRRVAGSVSGGCLEQDLIRRGWWHTRDGAPALLTFDSTSDDDRDGEPQARTGCGGVVEILLERVLANAVEHPLLLLETALDEEANIELLTVFRSVRAEVPVGSRWVIPPLTACGVPAAMGGSAPFAVPIERARRALARANATGSRSFASVNVALPDGSVEALAERLGPPPHLFVFGSGPDAVPVVALARALGWTITLWDPQGRAETKLRFAAADRVCAGDLAALRSHIEASLRPLAVVMSHNLEHDRQALAMVLSSKANYIGVLGPRRRTDRLLAALPGGGAQGEEQRGRLHAPVGLQLGAETPDEIALSIIAQAQAVVTGAAAGHLSQQARAIHGSASFPALAPLESLSVGMGSGR